MKGDHLRIWDSTCGISSTPFLAHMLIWKQYNRYIHIILISYYFCPKDCPCWACFVAAKYCTAILKLPRYVFSVLHALVLHKKQILNSKFGKCSDRCWIFDHLRSPYGTYKTSYIPVSQQQWEPTLRAFCKGYGTHFFEMSQRPYFFSMGFGNPLWFGTIESMIFYFPVGGICYSSPWRIPKAQFLFKGASENLS